MSFLLHCAPTAYIGNLGEDGNNVQVGLKKKELRKAAQKLRLNTDEKDFAALLSHLKLHIALNHPCFLIKDV